MSVAYETSFTMRGATSLILQRHQVLHLPRKMTLMIDARHIWHVIYNARSNRHRPPTSPKTAPATQNCIPKSKKNCQKTDEVSFTMRDRSENDPRMIRPWSEHEIVISHPPVRRGYFSRFGDAFCIENYNISRSGYLSKFPQILRLPRKVTLQDHQILRLPRKMLLYWTVTLLSCYFTELLLYWTVTLLICYFTELLLDWAVTLLSCYFNELLLSCYFTELLLYWSVTWLSCYLTELLLYWAVTLMNCYWTVTLLSCYFTGLFAFLNLRNSEVSQLNFLWPWGTKDSCMNNDCAVFFVANFWCCFLFVMMLEFLVLSSAAGWVGHPWWAEKNKKGVKDQISKKSSGKKCYQLTKINSFSICFNSKGFAFISTGWTDFWTMNSIAGICSLERVGLRPIASVVMFGIAHLHLRLSSSLFGLQLPQNYLTTTLQLPHNSHCKWIFVGSARESPNCALIHNINCLLQGSMAVLWSLITYFRSQKNTWRDLPYRFVMAQHISTAVAFCSQRATPTSLSKTSPTWTPGMTFSRLRERSS